MLANPYPIVLGGNMESNQSIRPYCKGAMADVRIYQGVLSGSDLVELFDAGPPKGFCPADLNGDGVVDADALDAATWYGDADGDGYGSSQFVEDACAQPDGYVANSSDCDDLDASSYPGAPEGLRIAGFDASQPASPTAAYLRS